ncbi:unnamed protein product [Larinioides sclopetarius]|uniref:Uncharacterized protein n=1 Tax=Larinioides sclopetarius TaxID=280406 RepID=A0AAV1Z812_9ARAC
MNFQKKNNKKRKKDAGFMISHTGKIIRILLQWKVFFFCFLMV